MTNYRYRVLGQEHTITTDSVFGWAFGLIVDGQIVPHFCADHDTAMRWICAMDGDRSIVPVEEV